MIAYTNYSTDARVRREAETLAALPDYKVFVLTLKESSSPRTYHLEGVEVRELNARKYQGKRNSQYLLSYLRFMFLVFLASNKLLIHRSVDIVHVHNMPNFLVFSALPPLLFGRKIILDIHDTLVETYLTKFTVPSHPLLIRALYLEESISCGLAHKIICVNHVQRKALVKRGIREDKTVVLLNVPDPKIFHPTERTPCRTDPEPNFKIIYHGTVTTRLSVDLALLAVTRLVDKIPGLEFYVLGDGEGVQEFRKLSEDLGIQEVIYFMERVPFEKMIAILRGMDLGIVPNRRNMATELMLPVKMIDCIALGIPVVVPRLRAIEYYFSDDMVTYFEPGDLDSLATAILDVFANRAKGMEKAENAKRFVDHYGWETHKFDLVNLYRSL